MFLDETERELERMRKDYESKETANCKQCPYRIGVPCLISHHCPRDKKSN